MILFYANEVRVGRAKHNFCLLFVFNTPFEDREELYVIVPADGAKALLELLKERIADYEREAGEKLNPKIKEDGEKIDEEKVSKYIR